MNSYNKATRKGLEGDRIAVCPQFGCETIERIKPLKLGFFGFHKFPKCAVHKVYLVFVDEFIEDFLRTVNACLFDISGKPPQDLMFIIRREAPKHLISFINRWMYCSLLGRGAEMVPDYMNSLSTAYIKSLSKRQQKSIREQSYTKKKYKMLNLGIKRIEKEYIEFIKNLREKLENLYDEKEIKHLPEEIRKLIHNWLDKKLENTKKNSINFESKDHVKSLSYIKEKYDNILQAGTCSLLLGKSPSLITNTFSIYELLSAYNEFLEAGLCQDITSIDYILDNFKKEMDLNNKITNIKQQYNPEVIDNLNNDKKTIPNEIFSINIPEIKIKDIDVKTRGWNYFRDIMYEIYDNNPPKIYRTVLKISKEFIEKYIKSVEPSLLEELSQTVSIQTTFGRDLKIRRDYLIKENPSFDQVLRDRLKYGFRWILYNLKCKIFPFKNKIYIGWSKNRAEYRFKQHIIAAIGPHGKGYDYVNVVKLHKAIRKSLEKAGINYYEEWNYLENKIGTEDYESRINYVFGVVRNYFDIETLEMHRNFGLTKEREKYYTLNYKNNDGTIGTIKNGLNEIAGGGGGFSIKLPYIDIFAIVTLGKLLIDIYNTIIQLYHINIAYSTFSDHIREVWESFEALQEDALKPILEKLIKDKQDFKLHEISEVLNLTRHTLNLYLKKWYKGRTFSDLKEMVKNEILNWDNLQYFSKHKQYTESIEKIENVPIWIWLKWLVEGKTTIEIAKEFGLFRKTVSKFIKEHPQLGNNSLSIQELRYKLRRYLMKNLLKKGWNPYDVVEKVFKMNNTKTRRLFKQIFPNKSFEEIIQEYSGGKKQFSRIFHKQLGENQKRILRLLILKGDLFLNDINNNVRDLSEDMIWSAVKGLIKRDLIGENKVFNQKANRITKKYYITKEGINVLEDHWTKPKLS